MTQELYFKLFIFIPISLVSTFLATVYLKSTSAFIISKKPESILTFLLLVTFLVRLPYVLPVEVNVDTSTWLASVIAIKHYPDWLWTFLNYTDSRPLTVFPLIAASWIGIPVNYYTSECLGIIFWLGTVLFLFKILNFYLTKTASLIICWGLCLLIGTMYLSDYTSYNSEQSGILMITGCVYGYLAYLYQCTKSNLLVFTTGFVLGNLVFVKFQNVPMGLLIAGAFLLEIITRKEWRKGVFLILGGVLPTLVINFYYLKKGELGMFWDNYFWNYFYYSYTTQFSNLPISERFSPLRIVKFIYNSQNSRIYFFTITILILCSSFLAYKPLLSLKSSYKKAIGFGVLLIGVSLYSILQSGNSFQHYRLYLLIPLSLFFGLTLGLLSEKRQQILLIIFLVCCTFMAGYNLCTRPETTDLSFNELDEKIIGIITKATSETDPIVVWGWRDQLYVRSNRPMGFRDAHTFHFALKSKLIPTWTADFLDDMQSNKPELFIDVTTPPEYSIFSQILVPYEHNPDIKNYINSHYQLHQSISGVRIYKRLKSS